LLCLCLRKARMALVVIGSRARISSGAILMLSEVGVPVLIHGKRGMHF
jgi:CRISPR/Cas system-associated endonuclease Cas1